MKKGYEYYFNAIVCFVFSFVFILISIVKPSFLKKGGVSIAGGLGFGMFFLVVGLINYSIAKGRSHSEKEKDKKIKQLEKKLLDLKGDKLKDYKMRDFD